MLSAKWKKRKRIARMVCNSKNGIGQMLPRKKLLRLYAIVQVVRFVCAMLQLKGIILLHLDMVRGIA
ncbi:Histidinol-phosphate aminotransferase [Dirofilaria immitis]